MATDFISHKGRGRWATSSISTVWLVMLLQEITLTEEPPLWLIRFREIWELQVKVGQCLSAGLDEIEGQDQKIALLDLFKKTLVRLEAYGDSISVEILNSLGIGGVVYLSAIDTRSVINVGRLFIELLNEEVTTDSTYATLVDRAPLRT